MRTNPEDQIPAQFRDRIEYGLYGGIEQFFINGVDGTLAELGSRCPAESRLAAIIMNADREHAKLIARHNK